MRKCSLIAAGLAALTLSGGALAHEAGDFFLRFGASNIVPESDGATVLGLDAEVDSAWGFTINGTYMLSRNWGVELLAVYPYTHDIKVEGLGDVGEVSHLPPTLSIQYHFLPEAQFQPYVGVGVNYTYFYDDEASGALKADGASLSIKDNSWGFSADIGADWILNEKWFVNFDVRYIQIDTEAEVTFPGSSAILTGGGTANIDVDVNPWVYGVHLGYRF